MIITKQYIAENPLWFTEAVGDFTLRARVSKVEEIRDYLLGQHRILRRENGEWKEEEFETAKIVLNTVKTVLTTHVNYLLRNEPSLTGDSDIASTFNKVLKRGRYHNMDKLLALDLYRYGNAFEYVYLNGDMPKSKLIANEDAFPIYDDMHEYIAFVEYWKDTDSDEHYIVYYDDRVESWHNQTLVDTKANLTGLPIHYAVIDKAIDRIFGNSMLLDAIPIMDYLEYLLSKLDDHITTLALNPIGVMSGKRIEGTVDGNLTGHMLQVDTGDTFEWKEANADYNNIKFEFDQLLQQFYAVCMVSSTVIGQSNIANVSEVSLKMLYNMTDNKAGETISVLKDGYFDRYQYFRKLLAMQGTTFTDDAFDTIDVIFNINRPTDNSLVMEDLERQYKMGAISRQTIIDVSPYTTNTASEMERLKTEQQETETENISETEKEIIIDGE